MKLHPNPVNNVLTITTEGLEQGSRSTLSIMTHTGAEIKTIQLNRLNKTIQVNVSGLRPETYFVKLKSGNTVMNKQFVKM